MQTSAISAWSDILSGIAKRIGQTRFNLWFKNTVALSYEGSKLDVGVPSAFMADWLETHYRGVLAESAREQLGGPVSVSFVIDGELFRDVRREEAKARKELLEEAAPETAAAYDARRYTLGSFVVGPCNSVAFAAAEKVAQNPGNAYNPLFVHGGVGLGKTHLLMGIAHAVGAAGGGRGVEYVSAEAFTNRFLFGLRNSSLDAFRRRYRRAKLLIIDDIHFLANKPATQDEFLSTYNALENDGSQIVMASDSHPKLIGKLKETLVTRFLSGMVARLEKPGYATRLQIVKHKALERGLKVPEEIAEFVARSIKGSVRELEGAMNTLVAYAHLSESPINSAVAREALKGLIESYCRPVRLPEIEAAVTAYAGLSEGQLRSRQRTRPVSRARHLAMYLARQMGGFSYSQIGAFFGGRNHSSVASAVEKITVLAGESDGFAREVAALKAEFGF